MDENLEPKIWIKNALLKCKLAAHELAKLLPSLRISRVKETACERLTFYLHLTHCNSLLVILRHPVSDKKIKFVCQRNFSNYDDNTLNIFC